MKILDTHSEEEASINMTPLIDMVFLLLIFFLVATTFAQAEKDQSVNLPGSDSPKPLSAPPNDVIVNITRQGAVRVGGRAYSLTELTGLFADLAKNQKDRDVLIRADKDSRHEHFARVVDLAYKAGISKTKIGYIIPGDTAGPSR